MLFEASDPDTWDRHPQEPKRFVRLNGLTQKGRNKIREAGTDVWEVTETRDKVPCLSENPGMRIMPQTDDVRLQTIKARWIHLQNDPDFNIVDMNLNKEI